VGDAFDFDFATGYTACFGGALDHIAK